MSWNISGGVANQPNTPKVDFGFGRNEGWFDASVVLDGERVIASSSQSEATTQDRINLVSNDGTFGQNYAIDLTIYPRPSEEVQIPQISVTNNGGVSISSEAGFKLTTEDNGDGVEDIVTLTTESRTLNFPVSGVIRTTGEVVNFVRFVEGTLARHCDDAVVNRIQNATTAALPIFNNYSASNSTGNYTRNVDCWAYDLRQAMTCISPWNSNAQHRKAGVLLDVRNDSGVKRLRYIANAAHYEYPVGTTVRFVTADNVVVERSVIDKKRHPDYGVMVNDPDITIYLLNDDLPEDITPCTLLPTNYENFLPTGPTHIAALCLDQEEKALVTDLSKFDPDIGAQFKYPEQELKQTLYEDKITGDSGNPAFIIVNDTLVCLTFWTFGGVGRGTFLTPQIATMNQMIEDLDTAAGIATGYTIQTVNLSSFTDFS